jgi:hypothetical protein
MCAFFYYSNIILISCEAAYLNDLESIVNINNSFPGDLALRSSPNSYLRIERIQTFAEDSSGRSRYAEGFDLTLDDINTGGETVPESNVLAGLGGVVMLGLFKVFGRKK